MARHKWGGAQSRSSVMSGLRTRYENGRISTEAYVRALRREADYLDEHNRTSLIPSRLDAQRARAYRATADRLDNTHDDEEDA